MKQVYTGVGEVCSSLFFFFLSNLGLEQPNQI